MPQNRWTVWKRSSGQGEVEQRIFWDQPAELMFIQVLSRKHEAPHIGLESHVERLYDPRGTKEWLRDAGFTWIVTLNEATGESLIDCAPRIIFLARKGT